MNMIAGLETVTQEIPVDGQRMIEMRPAKRDIAMAFRSCTLYPGMIVRGNISFGMEMQKLPGAGRGEKIARVAKMLQITDLPDRRPGQLSGGQRQRVAGGRAPTPSARIAVMRACDMPQIGTPRQICDLPADVFAAGFLNSPAVASDAHTESRVA